MTLAVVILAKDEEKHIVRALESVKRIADQCFVVDSGSSDRTVELARQNGARVLHNAWINYATQFNWAIDHLPEDVEWIMRLDADEFVTEALSDEIFDALEKNDKNISGFYVSRVMCFLGRRIRWGGVFPIRVLRVFRRGSGRCENRWMDEHLLVKGATRELSGEIVDDNLNSIDWWTDKHNLYASREVIDLLNLEFNFMKHETVANLRDGQQAGIKRWLKEKVYSRLPMGLRAFLYFLYRYVVRLGFLDGREGTAFHVLQGFWYRYLVDVKLHEVRSYYRKNDVDIETAIAKVLSIDLVKGNTK